MLEVKSVSGFKGKKALSSWGMGLGVSEGFLWAHRGCCGRC